MAMLVKQAQLYGEAVSIMKEDGQNSRINYLAIENLESDILGPEILL